jgi:predicted extracellular nuclease
LGQQVTTSGVVTRLNNNGFFMQDANGDGDAATSDGIFVFTSSAPTVALGQLIQLTGTVAEFNTGAATNADTLAHGVTQITSPSNISLIASNQVITPVEVQLPETINDDLERVEGMLVTLNGPLTASQNYFQGRYGQVTLSVNGRMEVPTNKFRPNTAGAINLAYANQRSRIILDDGTSQQNPNPTPYIGEANTLRAGDTLPAVTGVIDYGLATSSNTGFGDYKIHPTQPVSFTRANPRSASPEAVPGNIKVASFNVLNFFTTFTDGTTAFGQSGQGCSLGGSVAASNCRGANNAAEFSRQRNKIIAAIAAINADVVGLMEIQNNGNTAVQYLVDGLNASLGAGTYAALALPSGGMGDDAIRVAMIYKPAALSLVGSPLSDTDPINNRPTLLQTFAAPNGQQFSLAVNHFKSKGSCPAAGTDSANEDAADGQGCWNGLRLAQAQRLRSWLASLGADKALIIGDLNAYAQEDPVFDFTSHGYIDQVGAFNSFGYSYVFDGAAGRLDHAISSAALSPWVAGVKHWHINADEPSIIDYNLEFKQPACPACGPDYYTPSVYRSSDHDPVIVGLNLNDLDADGLTDAQEVSLGTNPQDRDSDDDGLADGSEDANHNGQVDSGETNPTRPDTDGDGLQDGTELGITSAIADPDGAGPLLGTNVSLFQPDLEPAFTTNPNQADTDGDGSPDGIEDSNHNGRLDAGEYDPLSAISHPQPSTTRQVPSLPIWAMVLLGGLLVGQAGRVRRQVEAS